MKQTVVLQHEGCSYSALWWNKGLQVYIDHHGIRKDVTSVDQTSPESWAGQLLYEVVVREKRGTPDPAPPPSA